MTLPRIGFGLPAFGPEASPDALLTIATSTERLGFHAVSLSERLLLPATPDWTNDFGLPEYPLYDTLETLTWVAAKTERIKLVTGILQSLLQPPVVLARRLATLDHLSGGRLGVGIGQGWMPQEYAVAGVPMSRRGSGFEEHLAAMRACWGPDPVEFDGPRYPIARARIGPKPINGLLPVYVGGLAPQAVERAARLGDGFITALRDWDTCVAEVKGYRNAGGRGPVVLRGNPSLTDDRSPATVVAAMTAMLVSARESGVDELHFDLTLAGFPIAEQVTIMTALAETIGD
jgi:probable F420-dependent oxidoreductase